MPRYYTASGHFNSNAIQLYIELRHGAGLVAARYDAGRAIVLAEIADRPDRIEGERLMRLRQWNQLIVGMQRLCSLAGAQRNRTQGRKLVFSIQDGFGEWQYRSMGGHLPIGFPMRQQVVYAYGLTAFEVGVAASDIEVALGFE